jgi:hypothetical protein
MIVNKPHALYYNGELIGIITNPDPYGRVDQIADALSPDEGAADIRWLPTAHDYEDFDLDDVDTAWSMVTDALTILGAPETIKSEDD